MTVTREILKRWSAYLRLIAREDFSVTVEYGTLTIPARDLGLDDITRIADDIDIAIVDLDIQESRK